LIPPLDKMPSEKENIIISTARTRWHLFTAPRKIDWLLTSHHSCPLLLELARNAPAGRFLKTHIDATGLIVTKTLNEIMQPLPKTNERNLSEPGRSAQKITAKYLQSHA